MLKVKQSAPTVIVNLTVPYPSGVSPSDEILKWRTVYLYRIHNDGPGGIDLYDMQRVAGAHKVVGTLSSGNSMDILTYRSIGAQARTNEDEQPKGSYELVHAHALKDFTDAFIDDE